MGKGIFITLEGPEGSRKSTQVRLLAEYFGRRGRRVLVTCEPGGTELSQHLRRLLLDPKSRLSPLAELFLYEADRAQHMDETVLPALRKGLVVLCDRFSDSTLAYQGYGRGLDRRMIGTLNGFAIRNWMPDLTLLLDIPVEQGLRRAGRVKKGHDRLEKAGLAFHKRVRKGFLALAKKEPKRFRVIPQKGTIEETQVLIRQAVDEFERRHPGM